NEPGDGKVFGAMSDIEHALEQRAVTLHSKIKYRWRGIGETGKPVSHWYDTTPGPVILGQVIPRNHKVPFEVVNKLMTKREICRLIDSSYRNWGQTATVVFCDYIMALAFHRAFKASISYGKDDMVVAAAKWKIVDTTRALAKEFEQQFNQGLITQVEKYNKELD